MNLKERIGRLQRLGFEFKDKGRGGFTGNLPKKTVSRMDRIMKLEKEFPPSKEVTFESDRSKAENAFIATGEPIKPKRKGFDIATRKKGAKLKARLAALGDDVPVASDTLEQARARKLITTVQKNRKLQKFMNTPEGRKANKLFVEKGVKINPSKFLKKQRMIGARQKLAQETPKVKDVKINPTQGRQIANGFDKLKHEPNNPKVKSAYGAFIKETNQQFKDLQDKGFKFSQSKPGTDSYPSSDAMNKDIARKQLKYFPTSRGFGRNAQNFKDHPLLKMSPFKDAQGNPMTNNDTFRAVHDVNGHNFGEAADFSFAGEEQAFRTHKLFYSKEAQKALFTETAGQANWGTFSKEFGASNRRNPANMVFSEQKAGLFPQKILNKRFHI